MSEFTRCNYCSLKGMRQRAEKRGASIILEKDSAMPGWVAARGSDSDKPSAWFLELTEECACG